MRILILDPLVVTLLVAKFPLSMCAAKVLPTIWMVRYFDQMLRWSYSLVINNVWQIRSAKEMGQKARGRRRIISMTLEGVAKVISTTNGQLFEFNLCTNMKKHELCDPLLCLGFLL